MGRIAGGTMKSSTITPPTMRDTAPYELLLIGWIVDAVSGFRASREHQAPGDDSEVDKMASCPPPLRAEVTGLSFVVIFVSRYLVYYIEEYIYFICNALFIVQQGLENKYTNIGFW
jgi:hypothetical protein